MDADDTSSVASDELAERATIAATIGMAPDSSPVKDAARLSVIERRAARKTARKLGDTLESGAHDLGANSVAGQLPGTMSSGQALRSGLRAHRPPPAVPARRRMDADRGFGGSRHAAARDQADTLRRLAEARDQTQMREASASQLQRSPQRLPVRPNTRDTPSPLAKAAGRRRTENDQDDQESKALESFSSPGANSLREALDDADDADAADPTGQMQVEQEQRATTSELPRRVENDGAVRGDFRSLQALAARGSGGGSSDDALKPAPQLTFLDGFGLGKDADRLRQALQSPTGLFARDEDPLLRPRVDEAEAAFRAADADVNARRAELAAARETQSRSAADEEAAAVGVSTRRAREAVDNPHDARVTSAEAALEAAEGVLATKKKEYAAALAALDDQAFGLPSSLDRPLEEAKTRLELKAAEQDLLRRSVDAHLETKVPPHIFGTAPRRRGQNKSAISSAEPKYDGVPPWGILSAKCPGCRESVWLLFAQIYTKVKKSYVCRGCAEHYYFPLGCFGDDVPRPELEAEKVWDLKWQKLPKLVDEDEGAEESEGD